MSASLSLDVFTYEEGERVFCIDGSKMYEAQILEVFTPEDEDELTEYAVHYIGWSSRFVFPSRRSLTPPSHSLSPGLYGPVRRSSPSLITSVTNILGPAGMRWCQPIASAS
jgi:hypothetical protein